MYVGYIRSNEDYYLSLGHSPEVAEAMGRAADAGEPIDEGFCNPIKRQLAAEAIEHFSRDPGNVTGSEEQ